TEPADLTGPRPALVVLNDQDLSYAKLRFDEVSEESALRGLSRIPDALTRAVIWNALRDMVRDGDLAPADYLRVALAHLTEETELALVQGVLGFARTQIADRYVTDEARPAALATIREIARALLRRTEDGEAGEDAPAQFGVEFGAAVDGALVEPGGDLVGGGGAVDEGTDGGEAQSGCLTVLGAAQQGAGDLPDGGEGGGTGLVGDVAVGDLGAGEAEDALDEGEFGLLGEVGEG
ncbi:ERAP1-like C-terminal domain-containing protein, partial [Streptomyces sp. adm13(2018)]|uniref:ERAP1-like C-terminal domain-containing protein n=1 Tax=Streptomyces sp. adm13(2018) TaxID=2479007 RepID=UPI0021C5CFC0